MAFGCPPLCGPPAPTGSPARHTRAGDRSAPAPLTASFPLPPQEVHETDVLGTCLTNYENKLEGDVLTVLKVKDVRSCSRRADIASYLSSAYNTDSNVQSLPVIDSTSSCTQTVEGGVLVDARCEESHSFTPFSGQRGGAATSVETSLRLVARDGPAATPTEHTLVRKTPVFEAAIEATAEGQVEAVTALLTQLEEAAREEVRPQAPALFSRLVIVLRGLDYPVLTRIYAATTTTHSRRFLVDAMPLVGTAAAAGLVRDMSAAGDLSQEELDAWFASLAHLTNPTSDIFTAIAVSTDSRATGGERGEARAGHRQGWGSCCGSCHMQDQGLGYRSSHGLAQG